MIVAVSSPHTFLGVELARIGLTAFLYSVSIFGWGSLICKRLQKLEGAFGDFILCRAVMGCFALYTFFLLLSAGGVFRPAAVRIVLAVGLVYGLSQARTAGAKFVEG